MHWRGGVVIEREGTRERKERGGKRKADFGDAARRPPAARRRPPPSRPLFDLTLYDFRVDLFPRRRRRDVSSAIFFCEGKKKGSGQTSDKPARRARGNIKRMRCLYVFTSNKRRSARFTRDVRLELRFGKVNMFIISTETFLINYGRKLLNCFLIWRYGIKNIQYTFFFTEKALRKKWKNIRDQFMKEFKKIPVCRSGDAGTDENTSRWPYFQMMLFIKDDVTPELNEGNLDQPTDGNSNDNERSPTPQSIAGSSTSTQYTSTKRKQAQDLRQEFMELEKKSWTYYKLNCRRALKGKNQIAKICYFSKIGVHLSTPDNTSHSRKRLAADVNTNSPRLSAPAPATAPARST
ncbi:hypothetical protein EVAR_75424_1 [Eumeta japonica]|uniref:MADF domain-containing protein n=1 Tax=Eumeta variegata TaxID=151549 RepID=A0A4C1TK13_EUMVA|nr:hypothetical protein EVAR_75424_1 [Eumeta japonica]